MKKIRVACMVRVSHEEQVRDGFSIQTQVEHLKRYVEEHNEMVLVDFYIDEGVSADKLKKRVQFQRLLKDVQEDKIDLIIFTKLDRWFRSVEKYYAVQPILDKHKVVWRAILEDYETETSSGRFKVNIMLSVAQNERERTSERIKDVFEYKVKQGEVIWGDWSAPYGFAVINKKLVHHPEEEPILKDLIEYQRLHNSLRKTMRYAEEEHGVKFDFMTLSKLLANPLLYGCYRENEDFCEPYITKEEYDELQVNRKKNIRLRETNNTYIFSGLLVCPRCGSHLVGGTTKYKKANGEIAKTLYYRCENFYTRNTCTFVPSKSEKMLEKIVMQNLAKFMANYVLDCEMKAKQTPKKAKNSIVEIQKEIDRLNNMYLKGRIDESSYDNRYMELDKKLKEANAIGKPIEASSKVKDLMGVNLLDLYKTFSSEEKQIFFRGLIKDIILDEEYNIKDIIFL